MQQRKKLEHSIDIPPFDEAILHPLEGEIVCAVRTMPLHEFKLEEYCRNRGLSTYLPLRRTLKFHNVTAKGRSYSYSKEVLRPLFTSYFFLKAKQSELQELYASRMLQRYLPPQNMDSFLAELRVVRKCELVGFQQELEVHSDIVEGGRFIVNSGIWEGVEGRLTRKDGIFKWTVEFDFCQQFITTIIDPTKFDMTPLQD